jgi:hypothetical protein
MSEWLLLLAIGVLLVAGLFSALPCPQKGKKHDKR